MRRLRCSTLLKWMVVSFAVNIGFSHSAAHSLTFDFSPEPGTSPEVIEALDRAGDLWSSIFADHVVLDVGFRFSDSLVPGAASTLLTYSYDQVRDSLIADQTSEADRIATGHLQNGPTLDLLINLTSDSPNGSNSEIPYLDNDGSLNNTIIRMTTSNAKALSLPREDALGESIFAGGDLSRDVVIILSPNPTQPWDFDRTDGIALGHTDFTGIVAHELAHVLGFSSGVDILDRSILPMTEDSFTWINTLDLFRFSEESLSFGVGVIDWTATTTEKIFSIHGGTTPIASFATGIIHGDGRFPGHWAVGGIGIMDPFRSPFIGQSAQISNLDITAIDVIGWDLQLVPEPRSITLAILGLLGFTAYTYPKRRLANRPRRLPPAPTL